ncbi:MAG: DinB family protein [Actinomycetota bacterium]
MEDVLKKSEVASLIDYMYWVNWRLLDCVGQVEPQVFTAESAVTTRSLRATLVHELDVEWSWRLNLQGRATGAESELDPESFGDVASLAERWRSDEAEMRAWLRELTDDQLAEAVHSSQTEEQRPLWMFFIHILTHASQQHADVATLLAFAGRSPGDYGYLDYLWSLDK